MSQLGRKAIEDLKVAVTALEKDYAKAEEGNKAAGVRARNTAQAMKKVLQGIREEIKEDRESRKTKLD
jgi:hypothetical protein